MIKSVFTLTQPLESVFIGKKRHQLSLNISMALLSSMLLAVAAQISIPVTPVSLTLLDMAAFFCGMAFGVRLSLYMLLTYYTLGCLGAPIFENGQSGVSLLLGFNLGYYIGLFPGVMLAAYLVENGWGRNILSAFSAAALGMAIMFMFGSVAIAMHHGWSFAWMYGISPFIGITLLKITTLSAVIPQIWTAVSKK